MRIIVIHNFQSCGLNVTKNRVPWSWSLLVKCNSPWICLTNAAMIFIPNPCVAAGSNASGKPGPSSETERAQSPFGVVCRLTVIVPFAYLIELVINSLAINPRGMAVTLGIFEFGPLNAEGSLGKFIRRHIRQIVAQLFKVLLELDAFEFVQRVEMPMNAPKCCDTVGGDAQLSRRLGIFGSAALHREQAGD